MLTDEQKSTIKAAAERQAAEERALVQRDEAIRARAYEIVQEAVNAPAGPDGKRPPVPPFSAALEQARRDIEGADQAEKAAGGKVVPMRKRTAGPDAAPEPTPQP